MVEIRDLQVRYGDFVAVDGLSLSVPKGALLGLLGPNGAGKTTTINAICGLLQPTAGQVRVDGLDVTADARGVRARVGLVPQQLALYPTLTVRQNVDFFCGLMGLKGQRARDRRAWALALAQLDAKADAKVETLSGGMKRRLNLACGLLHDPPVIICDEPTTGVDPQSRNHLFETIRGLHAEGRTVIYTTHYMEEVEALCDRVAIVDRGRVVAHDRLDALLDGGDTTRFHVTAHASAAQVAEALAAFAPQVVQAPRTLEQVFLDLTGRGLRDGEADTGAGEGAP
ncbi:MAG: ABC transporter ATP-binding protein [Myxococcales bacterium]|nr:ABC transporter ATP-binding protein [Myxococcales bacterium]